MSSTDAAPPPVFSPSTIILNPFAQLYVDQASVQIAPWIMGTFADLFLQGILIVQVTNYFTFRDGSENKRRFTVLVVVLQFLCLLKTAQNIAIVWNTVITNFANPDWSAILVGTNWVHFSTSLMTAIIATYVQAFFVYRYWMLTKRWWVCVIIALGMVVSLVAAVLVIIYIPQFKNDTVKLWSSVHFIAAICVDACISIGTCIHLTRQKSSIQSTAHMINRLVRMTWQSAIPPAIMVLLNMIVLVSLPLELSHIALNMAAAKLYAIALMYTLNLRNELRGERMTSQDRSTNFKRSFVPGDVSYRGGQSHAERGTALAFGGRSHGRVHSQSKRIDGIHVETHISTSGIGGHPVELRDFTESKGISEVPSDHWDNDRKYHPS